MSHGEFSTWKQQSTDFFKSILACLALHGLFCRNSKALLLNITSNSDLATVLAISKGCCIFLYSMLPLLSHVSGATFGLMDRSNRDPMSRGDGIPSSKRGKKKQLPCCKNVKPHQYFSLLLVVQDCCSSSLAENTFFPGCSLPGESPAAVPQPILDKWAGEWKVAILIE